MDVTVGGSQKGLMLPAGLSFNAVSEKALGARRERRALPRSYWDWEPIIEANATGFWPYTPATNLLYGLREALAMLARGGACRRCSRATPGTPRPRARRSRPGGSRCCPPTSASTRPR